jgi:hypothetical protein
MKHPLKPSPSMVVAVVALIAALGGTAWALSKGSVKKRHIAKNAVVDKHLKEIDGIKLKRLKPSAVNADQNLARDAAKPVTLVKHKKIKIYAKCWKSVSNPLNPGVHVGIFLKQANGAIFSGDTDDTGNAVLPPGADETDRILFDQGSFAGVGDPGTLNIPDPDQTGFYVAHRKRYMEGTITAATKVGSPEGGDGPFGSGDRCLISGTVSKR